LKVPVGVTVTEVSVLEAPVTSLAVDATPAEVDEAAKVCWRAIGVTDPSAHITSPSPENFLFKKLLKLGQPGNAGRAMKIPSAKPMELIVFFMLTAPRY